MDTLIDTLFNSWASHLVNDYRWSWPICESIHFIGLTLLAGTVGAFDLRLLGIIQGVRPATLHRLLRFGIAGFVMLLGTGLLFICGAPDQYFYNKAFHLKVIALTAMGINALLFYRLEFPTVSALGPTDAAPRAARVMAAFSLVLLAAVILFGRMLTFFRPAY